MIGFIIVILLVCSVAFYEIMIRRPENVYKEWEPKKVKISETLPEYKVKTIYPDRDYTIEEAWNLWKSSHKTAEVYKKVYVKSLDNLPVKRKKKLPNERF